MIAIIKDINTRKIYKSAVFAVYHNGFFTTLYIIDKDGNPIAQELHVPRKRKSTRTLKQVAYVRELGDLDSWIHDDKWEGYDWFLSNKKNVNKIKNKKPVSQKLKNKMLVLNEEILSRKPDEDSIRSDNKKAITIFFNKFDWGEMYDYHHDKETNNLILKIRNSIGFKEIILTFHDVSEYYFDKEYSLAFLSNPSFIFENDKVYFDYWQFLKSSSEIGRGDVRVIAKSITFTYKFE